MKTFAIVNRKGGVGKTTTAVNLAYILATSYGKRVLLVDADSQGNASSICCGEKSDGLTAVLRGTEPYYENLIMPTDIPGVDLLPANEELGDLDLECMIGQIEPDFDALRSFIAVLEEDDAYDVCVIDCPPLLQSLSCLNGVTAADRVIIPADTTAYSAEGMERLLRQIDSIRRAVPKMSVSGVLVTGVRRSDLDEDAVSLMRENAPVHVFDTVIRRSDEPVRASSWERKASCEWSPWCNASRDYRAWVAELIAREGL